MCHFKTPKKVPNFKYTVYYTHFMCNRYKKKGGSIEPPFR